ncbi:hypothetical protein NM208_g1694 [Fusarium decemcellulare]|uniref:Uncharacterized protein n=1 Tax=Fusarium decemcellulare TaxID=57161 RepID=A0ACC1SVA0_9HYPO|nr:hypothetical protein NM208_g1694 [Fusarium decemcellulare]
MALHKPAFLRELTPRLVRIYLFASIGAMNFGYDNNWWSGAINSRAFNDDYGKHLDGPDKPRRLPSDWLSIATGTPIAGWIIGCLVASYLTSGLGRKMTIAIVCLIALVGMILQCAIDSYWGIMAGRLVNAVSMGIEANCVPMYMAELAPASIRGALVNFYQSWLYVGAILATATVYGSTKHIEGRWAYMTRLRDDALKALEYSRHGAASEEAIALELSLIEIAMQHEEENHRATSYADCFKGSNLHRTCIAMGVQCLQQAQGNSFLQSYLVIFLNQVGVAEPQLIACAKMSCSLVGCIIAFYLSDKLGRRPMLMGGSFLMAALMWIVSGLASWTSGVVSGSTAQGAIASILLYGVVSAGCWGSVMWTVTAEVATTQLRERTISIATIASFSTSLLITYVNPFMQNEPGNLGSRVGMIYGSMSVLALIFVMLVVPEMKGRSLEELDELFHSRTPAWKSTRFVATGVGAEITHIEGVKVGDADGKLGKD